MVELAIIEPNTEVVRHLVLAELLAQRGIENFKPEQLKRDDFGKPYLDLEESLIGYSFSNARFDGGSFGLMALADGSAIGIDVELWPKRSGNQVFVESVAAPEDDVILRGLGMGGYDAGLALWVIKEAALKCSGEVMVDPRNLAVSQYRDGPFRVSPSLLAGAALQEFSVALFELRVEKWPEHLFLCGAAMPQLHSFAQKTLQKISFNAVGWQLSQFAPRLKLN